MDPVRAVALVVEQLPGERRVALLLAAIDRQLVRLAAQPLAEPRMEPGALHLVVIPLPAAGQPRLLLRPRPP